MPARALLRHRRQLGDERDPKTGTQSINRLKHECAYEHWHRMLFARFLTSPGDPAPAGEEEMIFAQDVVEIRS